MQENKKRFYPKGSANFFMASTPSVSPAFRIRTKNLVMLPFFKIFALMYLESLVLRHFKNHQQQELHFSKRINCLVGMNGVGKTNLLDAIHYCCIGKSAFNSLDTQNIQHGEQFFSLKASVRKQEEIFEIICALQQGKSKVLKCNQYEYTRLSEHFGLFPLVLICPDDTDLIREGSDYRRKFFDFTLAQMNATFLGYLYTYSNLLKSRNAHLKQANEAAQIDWALLDTYDAQMLPLARQIAKMRRDFCQEISKVFAENYAFLTEEREQTTLTYQSEALNTDFEQRYRAHLQQDIFLKRTDFGVHKDDFKFEIGGHSIKKFGSQGQQKSYIIALKLAQFKLLQKHLKVTPLLLLDDIFDKLDSIRTAKLLSLLSDDTFTQVFITDANPKRITELLRSVCLIDWAEIFELSQAENLSAQ